MRDAIINREIIIIINSIYARLFSFIIFNMIIHITPNSISQNIQVTMVGPNPTIQHFPSKLVYLYVLPRRILSSILEL